MDEWTASEEPTKPENNLYFSQKKNNSEFGFPQREKCFFLVAKAKKGKTCTKDSFETKIKQTIQANGFKLNWLLW